MKKKTKVTLIDEDELRSVLCQPVAFYQAITGWRHYRPKLSDTPGDCEFLITNMVARGSIVCATLVHQTGEAYMSLLSPDEVLAFRDRLGEVIPEMGSALMQDFRAALAGRRN
jgi:hypothetical protein